ncbi:class A beta-lactamase [Belnapia sp. T6]|uniref:Beta-lactamase n=1 Tax=Belnapia mucosa TaxID=2804532 RepID=A0ABS1V1K7_9PROT|nr:class A beta-lactamase [Belnapia mucosa]MBL6454986.1 class A beta-lactamase [Belnapia mucosa]
MRRRALLAGAAALAAMPAQAADALAALEARQGGRLGVAILDTGTGRMLAHRGEERFPLCSTFKFLAAGLVLVRVDRGEERLDRHIAYGREALVPYSPVTGPGAEAAGLTMGAICDAAVTLSDNTAGNLMLDSFGGPAGLTAWMRGLGDPVTRLDRREPELNVVPPGDERDTTTPLAMVGLMRSLLIGDALRPASREQLAAWLVACRTGDKRLRAGLPAGWRVGDKTGTGPEPDSATNDIGLAWPPGRAPILIAAYLVGARGAEAERSAVLAEVGRIAARSA